MTVGALVLAAGHARRMGGPKPAMAVQGQPMVARVLATAVAAGLPALVVTGAHRAAVEAAIGNAAHIHAADHDRGLSHSLRAGVEAVPAGWRAVLVLLADMPFIRPDTLVVLASALAAGAPAVVPVSAGRRGNPAGFARALFPRLLALDGDRGAGALLDALGVTEVPVDDPGIHRDIDTPADLPG
jgi:molybdenum cofactor cytidylyltransferase